MALTAEQQALFDHARRSLPRWLTRGKTAVLEWLHAFTQTFDTVRAQGQDWLDITFFDNATGAELDQHALDRGTTRRSGESDATLRERLRNITDVVTEPALKDGVDALLAASGLGSSAWVNLRRDKAFCEQPAAVNSTESFLSRGYRMTNAQTPMGYIVILPYGTTAAMGQAVEEYLRQYGPAGYYYIVEIRGVP
jgi:hypothetical protein